MLRLPPLNALRAYEAAGRLLSFKAAAAELCVTQGAISRHIIKLEQHLGVALFHRSHRQVTLTPGGVRYLQETRNALLQISDATARMQSGPDARVLRIKAPPTCSIRWLVPRLGRFHALYPDIAVQLTTSHDPLDFDRDQTDVGIHYGDKVPATWHAEILFGEALVPICHKRLLPKRRRSPREIAQQVLLHSIRRPTDWRQWLDAAGLAGFKTAEDLTFENSTMTFQGAADGLGVAIAQKALVIDDAVSGRIEIASPIEVRNAASYYLVCPKSHGNPETVRAFFDWVAQEASLTRAMLSQDARSPKMNLAPARWRVGEKGPNGGKRYNMGQVAKRSDV
jgi:LysR family glycine cleavage system transcriptional activator